jgi:putative drug exporter of the RND superfamily
VLAIGVGVGMFSMLTLLPALLVTFPRGVFWPYRPTYGSAEPTYGGLWARVSWALAPRPRPVWITTAVVLGVLVLGLTGLKAHGLTAAQSFRGHPESVTGERVLARHFPAGAGTPVIVIATRARRPSCAPPSPPARESARSLPRWSARDTPISRAR